MNDRYSFTVSRRNLLKMGAMGLSAAAVTPLVWTDAHAAMTLTLADIGVGDPGDWSHFKQATGDAVNVVSIGNGPSAVVSQLLTGGGRKNFDIVNVVGGMQKPLAQNDLILKLDPGRIPNWSKNTYINQYLAKGTPGFEFIGYKAQLYGVPTVLQGDSFAYLPDKTGELTSYAALFDRKFKGYVAIEDNYTTTGQKTALYLSKSGRAKIADPADMTPDEIKQVIDFLIEQKKAGQFRVIWTSFEQAVNLLTSKEVYVMDCWEPMVFAARKKGIDARYADPKEGYLLWAMAAYIVNKPDMNDDDLKGIYELLNFMLGGWYGAKITLLRGYMTNPLAVDYAEKHPDEFSAADAKRVKDITRNVERKFAQGGTWQNRWPTHVDTYEEEWQRFKSA